MAGTAYETGWYLPSISELKEVYNQRATVNAAIALCGGKQFNTEDGDTCHYRSSSQCDDSPSNVYYIIFNDGRSQFSLNKKYPDNAHTSGFGYSSAIHQF